MSPWLYACPALMGYVIGSIPTGYWVGRFVKGIDVRNFGSGNLGATNVFRVLGWKAGVTTLLIDILKGYLAVRTAFFWYERNIGDPLSIPPSFELSLWLSGAGAVLGHSFSPFVKFRGGKGVATAAGMLITLVPVEASIALGIFALFFMFSRIVSLSSIMAAIALPVAVFLISGDRLDIFFTSIMAAFIVWRHRENITRLLNGTEKPLQSNVQS